ncbi:uncharacterized protein AMSG_05084 [Thecamonas trahens ATCC 50062]|uniref:Uncharacterized protein n=1 Tax=Thecamonas trahens ATCC 50062 TaxID=461836 RepID=A0A0L0D9V5_THETB|nr:hypothetical protein AMSG_05084 [Thecamonas trahens ATCC 50062]KNC49114.1 hypothetical protein AMSG_05084 [Thecamonas trahens ATCC 50062]|eukprot:XP_013758142.1 hypothetical protein AMSG_05084 [Thecamonas trahens ATCC 50062]
MREAREVPYGADPEKRRVLAASGMSPIRLRTREAQRLAREYELGRQLVAANPAPLARPPHVARLMARLGVHSPRLNPPQSSPSASALPSASPPPALPEISADDGALDSPMALVHEAFRPLLVAELDPTGEEARESAHRPRREVEGLSADAFAKLVSEGQVQAERIATLQRERDEAEDAKARAEHDLAVLARQTRALAEVVEEQASVIRSWEDYRCSVQAALAAEASAKNQWRDKVNERDTLLAQLTQESEALTAEHNAVADALTAARAENAALAATNRELEAELAARDTKIADLTTTLRLAQQTANESILDAVSRAETANTSLRTQLAHERARVQGLVDTADARERKHADAISALQRRIRDRDRKLSALSARSMSGK